MDYSGATSDEHFVSLWLGRHRSSPHTARSYSKGAARFLAFLAARGKTLRTAKLVDLDAWQTELVGADERRHPTPAGEKYVMSAHTRQQLAVTKSLLAKGRATGYLPFDIGAALELPRTRDTLAERLLTTEELEAILAATTAEDASPDEEPVVKLLYYLGCRVSELVQLRWKHVVLRPGGGVAVTIHGKGEKTRHVYLAAEQAAVILALRSPGCGVDMSEQYVFASRREGKHMHTTSAWRLVHAAVVRSGIGRKASPHWFRHAHASHALDAGAPAHFVRDTLGHASLTTTSRYVHVRPGESSSKYLKR
jgi:integrase/recombinase XerD